MRRGGLSAPDLVSTAWRLLGVLEVPGGPVVVKYHDLDYIAGL